MTDYTVVGKFRNRENTQRLVRAIRGKGMTCYDFTETPANPTDPQAPPEDQMKWLESRPDFLNDPIHLDHFKTDMEGLKNAKTVILLLPAGTSAHIEAGVAFGLGKKLILIGIPEKPETLYFIFDEYYSSIEEFLDTI